MTDFKPCGKCPACTHYNGINGNGYQPCHNPRLKPTPPPPTVSTPPIKWGEVSNVTPEQMNQIRELTLKKVFLSVLLISIPILLWKLDSIIMALKA
ncbi:hypothetical protein ABTA53_14190 [Acinetobacter baumannii]|uniref:hypothetical protein n=1 Tax=Acinetobacter baumannii TaxID=470 RepID=UPI001127C782|nr:hypothetical protein [Acinetobacter baumannii]MDA3503487.1 hypothetical protein [Acinetobacter baumannii]TPT30774.1 hypothetical protein FJU68_14215 [Acinetobacter baumannii]